MKKTATAKRLMEDTPLTLSDISRLTLELVENLGSRCRGLERQEMIRLLRRVGQLGVEGLRKREHTVTFEQAAWESVAARHDRRPTTRRDLRYVIRRMLKVPGAGGLALRSMGARECRDLLQHSFGSSPRCYRKARTILHSIFAYGFRHEWCDANPVDRLSVPRLRETTIAPLSLADIERLKSAAYQPEHEPMRLSLHLMLYCGARPTEVMRLQPDDICWEKRQLIIRPQTSKTGGGRSIPLRPVSFEAGLVGRKHIPQNWAVRWRALRHAAGFTQWTPDILRHTFASYHAAWFRNLPALQLEMGHRDSSLLQMRYIGLLPNDAAGFWRGCQPS